MIALVLGTAAGCYGLHPWLSPAASLQHPSEGKALVRFHRPQGKANESGWQHLIWDCDQLAGILSPQTVCVVECEPGEHLFICPFGYYNALRAELLPGRVYDVVSEHHVGLAGEYRLFVPVGPDSRYRDKIEEYLNYETPVTLDRSPLKEPTTGERLVRKKRLYDMYQRQKHRVTTELPERLLARVDVLHASDGRLPPPAEDGPWTPELRPRDAERFVEARAGYERRSFGEIRINLPMRYLSDEWQPVEVLSLAGVTCLLLSGDLTIGLEAAVHYGDAHEPEPAPSDGVLDCRMTEYFLGCRVLGDGVPTRWYLGGGLSYVDAEVTLVSGGSRAGRRGSSFGYYVAIGYDILGYSWVVGVDLRLTRGTDLGLFGGGDADGLEFGVAFGFLF